MRGNMRSINRDVLERKVCERWQQGRYPSVRKLLRDGVYWEQGEGSSVSTDLR